MKTLKLLNYAADRWVAGDGGLAEVHLVGAHVRADQRPQQGPRQRPVGQAGHDAAEARTRHRAQRIE